MIIARIRPFRRLSSTNLKYLCHRNSKALWTRVGSKAPTLKACLDQCITTASKQQHQQQPTVCFALLSKSFNSHEYAEAITYLSECLGNLDKTAIMGCIVDRTATEDGHGVNLLIGYNEIVQPFQVIDGPKRQKARSISVGRWGHVHDFDRFKYQDNTLDTLGWQSFQTISQPPLQNLDVFNSSNEKDGSPLQSQQNHPPSFILLASDKEPDQVLQSLDRAYPDTPKLGIVGASTPFLTGSAYTLFYQDQLMGAGMVGFAAYSPLPVFTSMAVRYPHLEPLGPSFKITRARGNIILDLDDQGATKLLINLVNQVNSSKDEAFYLAMYAENDGKQLKDNSDDEDGFVVARITSGDPSRGNMAVDTTLDLKIGQKVQFMKGKPADAPFDSHKLLEPSRDNAMVFGVVDLDHTIEIAPPNIGRLSFGDGNDHIRNNDATIGCDAFGATSENGMIVGEPGRPSQLHQVPFSNVIVN